MNNEKSEIPWGLPVGRKNNCDPLKFNPFGIYRLPLNPFLPIYNP